jgi:hydroxylaminobenzene mutase
MLDSQRVSRTNLLHGAGMMVFGLLFGAAIGAAPYPRLALGAHIQFTTNGVMFLVAGLVIAHAGLGRGRLSQLVLTLAPWGAWVMALSEAANSWWGAAKTLPIAAAQAGATGAAPWQENIVLAAHVIGALAVLAFWIVILAELWRGRMEKG